MKRDKKRKVDSLEELLGNIYDECRHGDKPARHAERKQDFIFHMTDWLQDLQGLKKLYQHPQEADVDQASLFLMGFLYHVVPHLSAAGRLLLDDIPDAFAEVGK